MNTVAVRAIFCALAFFSVYVPTPGPVQFFWVLPRHGTDVCDQPRTGSSVGLSGMTICFFINQILGIVREILWSIWHKVGTD